MTLDTLLRPDIAAMKPYTPVQPVSTIAAQIGIPAAQIIKLDANENPYGPAPRVAAALAAIASGTYAVYPDSETRALRTALAAYTGHPIEAIICGVGSDELIDLLMRAVLQRGATLLDATPTFGMYAFDAQLHGARVVEVPRDDAFDIAAETLATAALASGAKLLFLAAPNNPTGNPLARETVLRLLALPLLLVVDEAYFEFAGETVADLVPAYPNLVVLRTFSKWAGLAGMRVGYGLFHPDLAAQLWKIKQPYNVSVAAETMAIAALEDSAYRDQCIAAILAERTRLAVALAALPVQQVYPSAANFVLVRLADLAQASAVRDGLLARGILIRYFSKPRLDDCIRISIGTPAQNDALLAALGALLVAR